MDCRGTKAEPEETASLLWAAFEEADSVFVKKMSLHDKDWADAPNKHQYGPYIPSTVRDGGFFPPLDAVPREPGKDEIRAVEFATVWPRTGEMKTFRLVHYASKDAETHLTRVPKDLFPLPSFGR